MIKIHNEIIKRQKNFWSQCLFHPTDAVEDPWGRRILDRISADQAIKTVRIYAMLEDIVYIDGDGRLSYDFRLSDLRLDYLVEKGFDLLLAYAGMPDCIAASVHNKTSVSKNKTRYKGKMWNSAPPKDYALWEEVCYTYTRHIVERYGIERVSSWRMQCFNEPDIPHFFLSEYPNDSESAVKYRLPLYCKMYEAFVRGIRRVSEKIKLGGPALAGHHSFLGGFLDFVKEKGLGLDFISLHNYGTSPASLNDGTMPYTVQNNMTRHKDYVATVREHGFGHIPILVDEWGMACSGFYNREECPLLIARETEVFSAYFAKLIHAFTYSDYKMEMLCLCLSGQHEMTEDFSGFRNFFTLNFIAKPIYNAYILAYKLHESVLSSEQEENRFVLPTRAEDGAYAVMISYSSENFEENIPSVEEQVVFTENIVGRRVTVWCIDKSTTNPYRAWQREGEPEIGDSMIKQLRDEGRMKPVSSFVAKESSVKIGLSPNATFLITVE